MTPHRTRAVQVWIDVDEGIADLVETLNTIDGLRTLASCQGSIGEGGPEPYGPYVMVCWDGDMPAILPARFRLTEVWGGTAVWCIQRSRDQRDPAIRPLPRAAS